MQLKNIAKLEITIDDAVFFVIPETLPSRTRCILKSLQDVPDNTKGNNIESVRVTLFAYYWCIEHVVGWSDIVDHKSEPVTCSTDAKAMLFSANDKLAYRIMADAVAQWDTVKKKSLNTGNGHADIARKCAKHAGKTPK